MTTNAVGFAAGAGLISREDLAKGLQNVAQSIPQVGGEYQFLKMDKGTGEWSYGAQETLIEPGSLWAVNPLSIAHGWVCWDSDAGGAPIEEIMVPFTRPQPDRSSLPPVGNGVKGKPLGYQKQMGFQCVCVLDPGADGEDTDVGVKAEYKQSSVGAMKAFASIVDKVLARVQKGENSIVPIIKLKSDRYKHDKYGWIQNPIFEIVEWRAMDDATPPEADEDDAGGDADGEDPELTKAYQAEAAKNAAEAEAPRRRQRR